MTAAQAIRRLRAAGSSGVPSGGELGSSVVTRLRADGHKISWDRTTRLYRLEKDACLCTRCGDLQPKPRKSFRCDFCSIELGLMDEPKLDPPPRTHCESGHALITGNVTKEGRCLTCQKQHQSNRQQKRKLERAKAAA